MLLRLTFISAICTLLTSWNVSYGQELCMEKRDNDDALVTDFRMVNGQCLITVDVVQFQDKGGEFPEIVNTNPKLRTFVIDADYVTWICPNDANEESGEMSMRQLANKPRFILGTYIAYRAKDGVIYFLSSYSCAG